VARDRTFIMKKENLPGGPFSEEKERVSIGAIGRAGSAVIQQSNIKEKKTFIQDAVVLEKLAPGQGVGTAGSAAAPRKNVVWKATTKRTIFAC